MPYCQIKREYILLKTLKDTEKLEIDVLKVSGNGLKFFNTLKSESFFRFRFWFPLASKVTQHLILGNFAGKWELKTK